MLFVQYVAGCSHRAGRKLPGLLWLSIRQFGSKVAGSQSLLGVSAGLRVQLASGCRVMSRPIACTSPCSWILRMLWNHPQVRTSLRNGFLVTHVVYTCVCKGAWYPVAWSCKKIEKRSVVHTCFEILPALFGGPHTAQGIPCRVRSPNLGRIKSHDLGVIFHHVKHMQCISYQKLILQLQAR